MFSICNENLGMLYPLIKLHYALKMFVIMLFFLLSNYKMYFLPIFHLHISENRVYPSLSVIIFMVIEFSFLIKQKVIMYLIIETLSFLSVVVEVEPEVLYHLATFSSYFILILPF